MKRSLRHFLSGLAIVVWLSARTFAADELAGAFDAANRLYEQGKFAEAVSAYEKMVQSDSVSPALYFNLGNAFYKSGQVGRAIAAYRQAGRMAPRDPELRANLRFVRNQVQGPTLRPGWWRRWLDALTLNEWTVLASAALWIWLVLLILVQWRPRLKAALRSGILGGGIATALIVLCLAAAFGAGHSTPAAVVIADRAAVHNGPLDESPTSFTLHDGAEVALLDEKEDWLQISAGKQESGWVRRDQMMRLPGT
jgi:tetratricopeptide (TPR) repeat protein